MPQGDDPLVETWATHDRINRYLLAAIAPEAVGATPNSKGRSVPDRFAHIHNVKRNPLHLTEMGTESR